MGFELENVRFSYGDRKAVRDVSLEMETGLFHAVMGPNGCGKTTLLDLMAGYLKPDGGRVLLDGRELGGYGKRRLAKSVALVPQNYQVNFPYTVREIVDMGRYPHRSRFSPPTSRDLQIVEKSVGICGVRDLADRLVTELSGGEKQRVVFARAIAQDTPVLLLDEPCSGMDVRHALDMMKVAADRVRKQGATVVSVMHDINLAARFADNLVFMNRGRVVEPGIPSRDLNSDLIGRVFDVESAVAVEKTLNVPQVVFLR